MHNSIWLATALLFGLGCLASPAWADSSDDSSNSTLPMESVISVERQNAATLNQIADQINRQLGASDEDNSPDISDILPASLIDGLIDENGDVSLPLGITVYDAMGTTSIGFGSKF